MDGEVYIQSLLLKTMKQSQIVINWFPIIHSKRHNKAKIQFKILSNNAGNNVWIEGQRDSGEGVAFKFFIIFLAKFPPLELEN